MYKINNHANEGPNMYRALSIEYASSLHIAYIKSSSLVVLKMKIKIKNNPIESKISQCLMLNHFSQFIRCGILFLFCTLYFAVWFGDSSFFLLVNTLQINVFIFVVFCFFFSVSLSFKNRSQCNEQFFHTRIFGISVHS